jgi:predicted outer membrane protein
MFMRLAGVAAAILAVGFLGLTGTARAQEKGQSNDEYVLDALAAGTTLARSGDLARTQGGPAVQALAGKIVERQKAVNDALLALAVGNKLAWEAAQQRGVRAAEDAGLDSLKGKEFDAAYLKLAAGTLERLAKIAERKANETGDEGAAVRAQAEKMLRIERELLQETRVAQKKAAK